jgi:hypothetical protein
MLVAEPRVVTTRAWLTGAMSLRVVSKAGPAMALTIPAYRDNWLTCATLWLGRGMF